MVGKIKETFPSDLVRKNILGLVLTVNPPPHPQFFYYSYSRMNGKLAKIRKSLVEDDYLKSFPSISSYKWRHMVGVGT